MKQFKLGLALCLAMAAIPAAASDYEYLNVAADQTVYFAKVGAQEGNTVVLFMKWTAPDGRQGDFSSAFRCGEGLTDSSEGGWEPVVPESIGHTWYEYACKNRQLDLTESETAQGSEISRTAKQALLN